MKKKHEISSRLTYDELVRYAEIGELVLRELPGLEQLLRKRRRRAKVVKLETKKESA